MASYEKTTWATGDVVTAAKLNNIENCLEKVGNVIYGELTLADDLTNLTCKCYVNGYCYTATGEIQYSYEVDPPIIDGWQFNDFEAEEADPLGTNFIGAVCGMLYDRLFSGEGNNISSSVMDVLLEGKKADANFVYKFIL